MPTKTQQRQVPWPGILGGAIILLLLIWMGLRSPVGRPVINSPGENDSILAQAQGLSLQHLKDVDAGVELTERDRMDLRKAADLFDSMADYQSDNIAPFLGAGKIYLVLGNLDAAEKRLRQGLVTVPKKGAHPAQTDSASESHYLLSEVLFRKGDYKAALGEVDAAIAIFTTSPIYYSQRSSILIQLKRYSEAKIAAATALKVEHGYPRAKQLLKLIVLTESDELLDQAKKKLERKDYKGVIATTTHAIDLDPNRPVFLALRAACFFNLGQKDRAKLDLEKLIVLDPDGDDTKRLQQMLK